MFDDDLYGLLEISPYSSEEEVKDALTSYIKIPGIKNTAKFRRIKEQLNLFLSLGQELYNSRIDKFTKENDELIALVNSNSLKSSSVTRKDFNFVELNNYRSKKTKNMPRMTNNQKKILIIGGVAICVTVFGAFLFNYVSNITDEPIASMIETYLDNEDTSMIENFSNKIK